MERRVCFGVLIALCTMLGCQQAAKPKPYSQHSKAEIESALAERLQLLGVVLASHGGGHFSGTGKTAEGDVHRLEVFQSKNGLKWKQSYKSPDGKRSHEGEGELGP
jgi:hypothetical protein